MSSAARAAPMLIYDGDCGFCTSSARWIEVRWRPGPRAVPGQHLGGAELDRLGLTREDVAQAVWWVSDEGHLSRGHEAVGQALRHARGGWPLAGRLLSTVPLRWASAAVYAYVARHRHRLPGGTPACRP